MTYIDTLDGTSNIWSYDLYNGSARQITDFKTDAIFAYAWSPDKQLVYERGTKQTDVTSINYQK